MRDNRRNNIIFYEDMTLGWKFYLELLTDKKVSESLILQKPCSPSTEKRNICLDLEIQNVVVLRFSMPVNIFATSFQRPKF